jgi:hypothetical protein
MMSDSGREEILHVPFLWECIGIVNRQGTAVPRPLGVRF